MSARELLIAAKTASENPLVPGRFTIKISPPPGPVVAICENTLAKALRDAKK